jgi:molybdate transport system substrate-binding protein
LWLLLSCSSEDSSKTRTTPLRIYAAASLASVLPEVTRAFQDKYPDADIEFSFAASSILAKQIERGANADIYFSANTQWTDFLEKKNRIMPDTRLEFLSNSLVLIVPEKSKIPITDLQDLTQPVVQRIALADWAHVPAGMYAKEALENFGIWENIASRCLPALDVRAALTYVERGDADCGIVYRTDATISKKVKIVRELPAQIQPKIRYSIAKIKGSVHQHDKHFLSFMLSEEAADIFRQSGFIILEPKSKP